MARRWRKFRCGFRRDFMVSFDRMYYDGDFTHVNLGWVWFTWNLDGLPYLFQDREEED